MRWVILLVVLTGCPGASVDDDEPTPDAPTDTPTTGPIALHLAWSTTPSAFPGEASPGVTIDEVRFEIDNLRVVGDAGPLAVAEHQLEWDEDNLGATVHFSDIPAGIYSRIAFEVDNDSRIDGRADIDDDEEEFRIERLGEADVQLDISVVLTPGDDHTHTIEIDLARVAAAIDFASLPVTNGRRTLSAGDPQADDVLNELEGAFTTDATPQRR